MGLLLLHGGPESLVALTFLLEGLHGLEVEALLVKHLAQSLRSQMQARDAHTEEWQPCNEQDPHRDRSYTRSEKKK